MVEIFSVTRYIINQNPPIKYRKYLSLSRKPLRFRTNFRTEIESAGFIEPAKHPRSEALNHQLLFLT
jgi:hypothetical protein